MSEPSQMITMVPCPECGRENIDDGIYTCNHCGYQKESLENITNILNQWIANYAILQDLAANAMEGLWMEDLSDDQQLLLNRLITENILIVNKHGQIKRTPEPTLDEEL